jgi:hypothetical protein
MHLSVNAMLKNRTAKKFPFATDEHLEFVIEC